MSEGAAATAGRAEPRQADFEAIFRDTPSACVILDRSLRIVDMNRAYLDVTGSQREAILGRRLFDAFPSDGSEAHDRGVAVVRQSIETVFATGEPHDIPLVEYPLEGPDGLERRYWSATHVPVKGDGGEVRFIVQNTTDVTELTRLRAGERPDRAAGELLGRVKAIQAVNRSLWAEQAYLRRLFHEAPGFMAALTGREHVVEIANESFLRLVGRQDVVGRPIRTVLPDVAGQHVLDLLDDTLARGEPYIGRGMRIHLQPLHEGPPQERFVDFVYQPILDEDGTPSGIFVQGHDITEQKRAEAALLELAGTLEERVAQRTAELENARRALQAVNANLEGLVAARMADLKAANEEIQRFAYIVSHDLRSPLVNVMGFASELEGVGRTVAGYLDRQADVPAEVREAIHGDLPEALSFIRNATQRMDRLINAILRLSREGRRSLVPEPLALDAVIGDLVRGLAHRAEGLGATITLGELPAIESDRIAVEQVFGNLLDNALKYLRPDQAGRIHVRGWIDGPHVRIAVIDNGRGIAPRDYERIFDLFRRAGAQDVPGEGIGLAHVRALVRRLGGVVSVSSEPGDGATFIVTLPRVLTTEAGEEAA